MSVQSIAIIYALSVLFVSALLSASNGRRLTLTYTLTCLFWPICVGFIADEIIKNIEFRLTQKAKQTAALNALTKALEDFVESVKSLDDTGKR